MASTTNNLDKLKIAGFIALIVAIVPFGAPFLDRKAALRLGGHSGATWLAAWVSALSWLIAVPFLIVGALVFPPLLLGVVAAMYLWARRIAAMTEAPAHLSIREWAVAHVTQWRAHVTNARRGLLIAAGAIVGDVVCALLGILTGVTALTVIACIAAIAAVGFLVFVETRIGLDHRGAHKAAVSHHLDHAAIVAVALGVTPKALADLWDYRVEEDGSITVGTPAGVFTDAEAIEDRCREAKIPFVPVTVHLSRGPVLTLQPLAMHPDVAASRRIQTESNGLVLGVTGGESTSLRPGCSVLMLAHGLADNKARAVADFVTRVATAPAVLVEWEPYADRATTAVLDPDTLKIRQRISAVLGVDPWDVELELARDGDQIVGVAIERYPSQKLGVAADRRMTTWREILVGLVPGDTSGWSVDDQFEHARVLLEYGVPRKLAKFVPASELLLDRLDPTAWRRSRVGKNAQGQPVCLDFDAGPHALVVGGTGSGKSLTGRIILVNALASGFEILAIDPTKKMAGLKMLEPYSRGFFIRDVFQAAAALTAVYKIVRERVDLIDSLSLENWQGIPASYGVKPLMVFIDEVASLVTVDPKPVGAGPKDDLMIEWQEMALAQGTIQTLIGRISREARSAGVHLVLSLQRPDASVLSGAVRDQLGSIVQMVVPARPPSPESLGMIFPAEHKASAQAEITALNDGSSKGFALSYVEGAGVEGFRVGFIDTDEVPEYLDRIRVPKGVPLVLAEAAPAAASAAPAVPAFRLADE